MKKKTDFQMGLILCYKIFSSLDQRQLESPNKNLFSNFTEFFGTKIFFKNEANYQRQIMK